MTYTLEISEEQLNILSFEAVKKMDIWAEKFGVEIEDNRLSKGASLIFKNEEDAVLFKLMFSI